MYQYSYDDTRVGDWQIDREKYQLIQDALQLLLTRIEEWNNLALQHGAIAKPYEQEAADLRNMIAWGQERLNHPELKTIFISGISIARFRYIKAALLYRIRLRDAEIEQRAAVAWPSTIVDVLRASIQPLRDLTASISQPPSDLLTELRLDSVTTDAAEGEWDVFVCHASEDKAEFVRPFAQALREARLRVWYDEFTLTLGDSLRRSIDRGLARSRYGIVVLSPNFFAKDWPQRELDGLAGLEVNGRKVILPLWHKIDAAGVRAYSPTLADRVAASTSQSMTKLVATVLSVVRPLGKA